MNDITVEEDIKVIHDIQDDKEMFDTQMISNLKDEIKAYKRGAWHDSKIIHEQEAEIRRLRESLDGCNKKAESFMVHAAMIPEQLFTEIIEIANEAITGGKG